MDRRLLGRILMGLGVVLVAAGVVGLVTGGDDESGASPPPPAVDPSTTPPPSTTVTAATTSSTTTTGAPSPSTTTTASPASTTSTTSTTTTAVTGPDETPEEFFSVLKGALDDGDAATILERMNQATIDRYGADQCEAYAASIAGAGLDATLVATSDLASWDYTTDEVTTTLAGVVAADLERVVNRQTVPQTTHWQLVDGRYTWFTDCGSPV